MAEIHNKMISYVVILILSALAIPKSLQRAAPKSHHTQYCYYSIQWMDNGTGRSISHGVNY